MEGIESKQTPEKHKPVVFVDAEFANHVPREFMDDPFGYFESEGVNIKSGDVVQDETRRTREDPTATKDLPAWRDEEGNEFEVVGKKVNLNKGEMQKTGNPLHEFKVMSYAMSRGLPVARPIARAEKDGEHLLIMEKLKGLRVNSETVERLKKEHGFSDEDIRDLREQAEGIMEELKEKFEGAGIERKWSLKDMVLDVDLENKKVLSVTPVDWERAKLKSEEERFAELQGIWREVILGPKAIEVYEKLAHLLAAFRESHPNFYRYKLYHLLAGSTERGGEVMEFDTESGELEKILRSLKG